MRGIEPRPSFMLSKHELSRWGHPRHFKNKVSSSPTLHFWNCFIKVNTPKLNEDKLKLYWAKCSRILDSASILSHQVVRGVKLWCIILVTEEQNWSAGYCSPQNTSLWEIHRNYPSYLGWHNYHFFLYVCIDDYEMFKGTHQKNFKKDFYTYIHINTLIQRYIRKELSARFCTLILNSMPLQGLAISDQESGNEAVRVWLVFNLFMLAPIQYSFNSK